MTVTGILLWGCRLPPDRVGRHLLRHDLYLDGKISYVELTHGNEDDNVAYHLGPLIIPLHATNEPQAPRGWPTAIVTKWSGKR